MASHEDFKKKYGPWGLVAGASEGLGEAFARGLAARGLNVLAVARRAEVLEGVCASIAKDHGVSVRPVSLDLGAPDLATRLDAATAGLEVGMLVYNAAYSTVGPFLAQSLDDAQKTLDVNCRGPVVLAHRLGQAMAARGRGGMVVMASLAASQGSPLLAMYSASKAFDLVFAESLWDELSGQGIDVLACRAGATRTPNYERSAPRGKVPMMEPAAVVEQALSSLGGRPSMVPGGFNRVAGFLMGRLLSRKSAVRIMGRTTRKMYPPA